MEPLSTLSLTPTLGPFEGNQCLAKFRTPQVPPSIQDIVLGGINDFKELLPEQPVRASHTEEKEEGMTMLILLRISI